MKTFVSKQDKAGGKPYAIIFQNKKCRARNCMTIKGHACLICRYKISKNERIGEIGEIFKVCEKNQLSKASPYSALSNSQSFKLINLQTLTTCMLRDIPVLFITLHQLLCSKMQHVWQDCGKECNFTEAFGHTSDMAFYKARSCFGNGRKKEFTSLCNCLSSKQISDRERLFKQWPQEIKSRFSGTADQFSGSTYLLLNRYRLLVCWLILREPLIQ